MGFDPYIRPLKIWESIGTLTFKMEVHLGVLGFIPSLFCTPGNMRCDPMLPSWPATLQALALVMNPRLRLRQSLRPYHSTLVTLTIIF